MTNNQPPVEPQGPGYTPPSYQPPQAPQQPPASGYTPPSYGTPQQPAAPQWETPGQASYQTPPAQQYQAPGAYDPAAYGTQGGYGMPVAYGPARPKFSFMGAVKTAIANYVVFKGRASRSEYWYFVLANVLLTFLINLLAGMTATSQSNPGAISGLISLVGTVVSLALLLPSIGVAVRRLHDANKPGLLLLLAFVPFVNFYLIWLLAQPSDPAGVQYDDPTGAQPKIVM